MLNLLGWLIGTAVICAAALLSVARHAPRLATIMGWPGSQWALPLSVVLLASAAVVPGCLGWKPLLRSRRSSSTPIHFVTCLIFPLALWGTAVLALQFWMVLPDGLAGFELELRKGAGLTRLVWGGFESEAPQPGDIRPGAEPSAHDTALRNQRSPSPHGAEPPRDYAEPISRPSLEPLPESPFVSGDEGLERVTRKNHAEEGGPHQADPGEEATGDAGPGEAVSGEADSHGSQQAEFDYETFSSRILEEMNDVRENPSAYAGHVLAFGEEISAGRAPRGKDVTVEDWMKAIAEAVDFLETQSPVATLVRLETLTEAAADHVRTQGAMGAMGHTGADGSTPASRVARHGTGVVGIGENLAYGVQDPRDMVIRLLVDVNWPGREHRKNILNPSFRFAGVAAGPHDSYGLICVMDFAIAAGE